MLQPHPVALFRIHSVRYQIVPRRKPKPGKSPRHRHWVGREGVTADLPEPLFPTGSFRTQGGNERHAKFPADTGRSNACWEAGGSRDPRSMLGTGLHAGLGSGPSDLNQKASCGPLDVELTRLQPRRPENNAHRFIRVAPAGKKTEATNSRESRI